MRAIFASVVVLLAASSCASTEPASRPAPSSPHAAIAVAEDRRDTAAVEGFVRSEDPAVRARAARALGRIHGAAAAGALRALVQDPDPSVRAEALDACGLAASQDLDDRAFVKAAFDRGDAREREALARALGAAGRAPAAILLFELYADVRDDAVLGAAALASSRTLTDRFKTTDPAFEPAAGRWIAVLAAAARDPGLVKVRWKLAYALAATSRLPASDALLDVAADPDPLTRLFAARGLGKRPDTSAFGAAEAARAYPGPSPPSPAEIESRSRQARGALVKLAADPDARVACEAAVAVKSPHQDPSLVLVLVADLGRHEVFLRRAAVRALGRGRAGQYLDIVFTALERAAADPSPWVRAEAAVAAANLATDRAPDAVEAAARDAHPFLRARAAEAAAALPREKAIPILKLCSEDVDKRVAAAAAGALARLDGGEAEVLLRALLEDDRGLVRETAAESIQARCQRSTDLLADSAALVKSLNSALGPDLAEPRATILAALTEVESHRRENNRTIAIPGEAELRTRIRASLLDGLGDADPTVRAKARVAWTTLVPGEPPPANVKPPVTREPSIPGVHVGAFTRAPRVKVFTNRGDFEIELFHDDAPAHAESFLLLTERGRYDGTTWHRVELNFVVQGGDPLGDGTGGEAAWGGTLRDELHARPFLRGTVGMPKTDVPDSGGGQIFICLIPTPHLDGRYTPFGRVTSGLEVLDLLELGDSIDRIEVLDRGR